MDIAQCDSTQGLLAGTGCEVVGGANGTQDLLYMDCIEAGDSQHYITTQENVTCNVPTPISTAYPHTQCLKMHASCSTQRDFMSVGNYGTCLVELEGCIPQLAQVIEVC